jgi:hypothetical protein
LENYLSIKADCNSFQNQEPYEQQSNKKHSRIKMKTIAIEQILFMR